MHITFIGGGNMAGALITGLLQKGFDPTAIGVVEISAESRAQLSEKFGIATYEEISAAAVAADIIVLAVKPQQLHGVATQLRGRLDGKLVISIAAGVRSADLSRWLGGHAVIVRAMPNTPAMVLAGVTGLYALPEVPEHQRQQAETILGAVGTTLWLEKEAQMDAVTAISGSGPAYVFLFIEALQEAAVELGFTPERCAHPQPGNLPRRRQACQPEQRGCRHPARARHLQGRHHRARHSCDGGCRDQAGHHPGRAGRLPALARAGGRTG